MDRRGSFEKEVSLIKSTTGVNVDIFESNDLHLEIVGGEYSQETGRNFAKLVLAVIDHGDVISEFDFIQISGPHTDSGRFRIEELLDELSPRNS